MSAGNVGVLDLLSSFPRKVAFRLADQRTHFLGIHKELSRLQWLPTNALTARQIVKLRETLQDAYQNVPFYRRLMQAAEVRPEDIRSLEDLPRLPVVSKDEIRRAFPDDVVAKGRSYRAGIASFTSGSTQTPFYIYLDRSIRGIALATRLLFDSWLGIKPFDRRLDIRVFPRLKDRLFLNELQIPAFDVSSGTARRVFDRIKAFHPKALSGHPSALVLIAAYILENSVEALLPPKAVFPWGETLLPQHRVTLERAFQCAVLARYGAAELGGLLAQECSDGCSGYHVNTELGVLEIVDDEGFPVSPGQKGRVVVTNLCNRLMPLIRYDLGDIAVQGGSPKCGRGFPIVKSIEGRVVDLVETRTGSMRPLPDFHVPPQYWSYVWRYQFVQDRRGHLKVLLVPSTRYDGKVGEDILTSLQALAPDIDFEICVVSEIAAERSGKRPLFRRSLS
jgi:phenylacetate-CoA ligase